MINHPPSVLWHCWLGHQTRKNRRPYNLYCVRADVKPCSINYCWLLVIMSSRGDHKTNYLHFVSTQSPEDNLVVTSSEWRWKQVDKKHRHNDLWRETLIHELLHISIHRFSSLTKLRYVVLYSINKGISTVTIRNWNAWSESLWSQAIEKPKQSYIMPFANVGRHQRDAENVGLENAGPWNLRGWKTQDWKTWNQIAGVENAGPNFQGWQRQDKSVWNAKWLRIDISA